MIDFMNPNSSDQIRTALKSADEKKKLGVVAAVVGISGGESELRKIMNSTGEINIMDRGMLAIHLS